MSKNRFRTFSVENLVVCDHNEKLASGDQKNDFHFVSIFFFIFKHYFLKL